jgi:poly-beta-1,6-N-acetyl-D-glucosamine synthase
VTFLFWLAFLLIFYTYLGYPLLLILWARVATRKPMKGEYEPTVSVILSVYNEEKFIEKKIENLLGLDYPKEKIEILVGSDGSTDRTDEIVSKFESPKLRFHRLVKNLGKPSVLNALVPEAGSEILVFTDARQEFAPDAIRELVKNFNDPKIGCVSGELDFRDITGHGIGKGMDAYWRYEKFLRKKESDIGSMLGATGAIYAIRRDLFAALPTDILVDDMYVPLAIIRKGYRAVFDSEARAYDLVSAKGEQEFKRKVRTLAGNYQIFSHFPGLFNPFESPVALQLFSHKFLRLMVPFLLGLVFITNIFLLHFPFYRVCFVVQSVFYVAALIESLKDKTAQDDKTLPRLRRRGFSYMAYTFCLLNYAAVSALFQFIGKRTKAAWEKAY